MILTTHALAGAVIGKYVSHPALIIIFSLALHFVMDNLRHGEYIDKRKDTMKNSFWKIGLDLAIGLTVVLIFILLSPPDPTFAFRVLLGVFFSMFPDLLTLLYWQWKVKPLEKIFYFHSRMHRWPAFSPERRWNPRNALNDIVLSTTFALILFFI